ncbi:hypothetical protein [Paracoccus alcaliphilus]|uniref:hypothetical protein n=1 Tax=Paracoccus alcaliphilus TaxID=34002 RepID=UPI003AF3293F
MVQVHGRGIKKYLREWIVELAFQTPARSSKLDPYANQLTAWLVSDQRKSRKERRTAKLMHADLVKLGYDGSYERVAAFVRASGIPGPASRSAASNRGASRFE